MFINFYHLLIEASKLIETAICPLAFSHIPRYAPFSKLTNPLQGCDPYGREILRNKL